MGASFSIILNCILIAVVYIKKNCITQIQGQIQRIFIKMLKKKKSISLNFYTLSQYYRSNNTYLTSFISCVIQTFT